MVREIHLEIKEGNSVSMFLPPRLIIIILILCTYIKVL